MSAPLSIEYNRTVAGIDRHPATPRIKKIPLDLKRPKVTPPSDMPWHKRIVWRLKYDSQFLRSTVQLAFVLLCLWIGLEFYLFVRWGESAGATPFVGRPPGVEGFLPIGALMSLKYWIDTGVLNQIHPSGLFILIAILAVSVLLKKAFCSWLCPIGTLSESLYLVGQRIFGKNLQLPKWLDYPLRSLKYLLLLFFAYAISNMDVLSMRDFIEGPYNRMADVKMYLFFAGISSFALWTILALVVLSVLVSNFWCRFLCPYGALLGFLSMLSPLKITRQKSTCIDCELCTKACPAAIKVHTANRVWSDECTACFKCVEACPVKNTLDFRSPKGAKPVPSWVFGSLVVGIFVAITGMAMLTGHWQNNITKDEYAKRFRQLESSAYEHPFGGTGVHAPKQ
jgi:polyferredoxin